MVTKTPEMARIGTHPSNKPWPYIKKKKRIMNDVEIESNWTEPKQRWRLTLRKNETPAIKQPRNVPLADTFKRRTSHFKSASNFAPFPQILLCISKWRMQEIFTIISGLRPDLSISIAPDYRYRNLLTIKLVT